MTTRTTAVELLECAGAACDVARTGPETALLLMAIIAGMSASMLVVLLGIDFGAQS